MITRISKLPTVLSSYAYRAEYIRELEGMIPTIKEHYLDWPIGDRQRQQVGFISGKARKKMFRPQR